MTTQIKPYYIVIVETKELDLSHLLLKLELAGSIMTPYQTVILTMMMDSKDMITDDLFGKKDLTVTIQNMAGEDATPLETIKFDLITVKVDLPLTQKPAKSTGDGGKVDMGPDNERSAQVTFTCIIKDCFNHMTKVVNKLYDESTLKKPLEIVEDIAKTFNPDMKLDIKNENENVYLLPQFIIPPMTFMNFIKYLDGSNPELVEAYGRGPGIFDGPMFFQCEWEENTFHLWDLGSMVKQAPTLTFFQVSGGTNIDEITAETDTADDKFIITDSIKFKNSNNQDIMVNAYKQIYRSNPSDTLYTEFEVTADQAFDKAINDGKDGLYFNETLKDRIVYRLSNEPGWDDDETFAYATWSRKYSSMTELEFKIDRKLALTKLIKVGVTLEFVSQTTEYNDMQGKYIVSSSHLNLQKKGELWTPDITIKAIRSNMKV